MRGLRLILFAAIAAAPAPLAAAQLVSDTIVASGEAQIRVRPDTASIDIGAPSTVAASSPVHMNCPVCHTRMFEMADQAKPSIHFAACKVCYGLFFDAGKYREHKEAGVMSYWQELFHRKGK